MIYRADTQEGIRFGSFDSISFGLYLLERDAPSPNEKEIIEDIPFMQGTHDFSMLQGERIFENRGLTYKLKAYRLQYPNRKLLENEIKERLMSIGEDNLYDSHEIGYNWFGKCTSVTVDDSQKNNTLTVTLKFSCYPFLLTNKTYYDDLWDGINFDKDVLCFSKYLIKGSRRIIIINNGSTTISPMIHVTNDMSVRTGGVTYAFKRGYNQDVFLKIKRGENQLNVTGNGRLSLFMNKELMA